MSSSAPIKKNSGGSILGEVIPRFKTISPMAGQAYLVAAQEYCLRHLSEVVSIFVTGVMPVEMVEFEQSFHKSSLLARKAGKYNDKDGNLATVDQTCTSWRQELIADVRKTIPGCSSERALSLLFPSSAKKNREAKRNLIAAQSLELMQKLNLLWPSESLRIEMNNNLAIRKARECLDLSLGKMHSVPSV